MSETLTVKSLYKNDIRRFPVNVNCTWINFIGILSKLYDTDISTLRLTYRDEEGDDIAVTTDDELQEAFRLAVESKPPLLRLLIAPANLSVSLHSQNLLHSVVQYSSSPVQNNICLPSKVVSTDTTFVSPMKLDAEQPVAEKRTETIKPTPTEPKPEKSVNWIKKEENNEKPLPAVVISGRAYVPKANQPASKPYTGPTKIPPSSNPQQKPSLVSITNNLAESISSLVLESSDSTLVSSSLFSDAISEQSQKLSDKTGDSNIEIAQAISQQTHHLANKSEAGELDDAIRRSLSEACYETGINSVKLSDKIAAITNQNSNQISEDIEPISGSTRDIQDAALKGLEDHLSQKVDDVVRNIMSATKIN